MNQETNVIWGTNEKGEYTYNGVVKKGIVPFIEEVEIFNDLFGKVNNYKPTLPSKAIADFVYNFILEELEELKEGYETGNIVEVLDAFLDIQYVLADGMMKYGLKDKILSGYAEVQLSNLSKVCKTEEIAKQTVELRSKEQKKPCHYEKVGDNFIVYRTWDGKVMKAIDYFKPDLSKLFSTEELNNIKEQFINLKKQ